MSTVIRRLAWSRLSNPRVAVALSGLGLLLSMVVGATAQNTQTLPAKLPLTSLLQHWHVLPALNSEPVLASVLTYGGDLLACLGLAGMLWAHSQGWRPNPVHLLLVSAGIVAVMACLTPVGSSDTASYAAYGRIAALGGNPYTVSPTAFLGAHSQYITNVGFRWKTTPSVYGPVATVMQEVAALAGGANAATTIWVLMILNGLVFVGVGVLLLKTSDDPVRATLFWTANPVIIQRLVSGGHLDTFVAAAAICAIQVARRAPSRWGDLLIGLLIGVACGFKATGALIGLGLAWPLLQQREWLRTARIAAVALAAVVAEYSFYGITALKPLLTGSSLVGLPSPWWVIQQLVTELGMTLGVPKATMISITATVISCLWPIAMIIIAWLVYQRISADQPREVVAPFALTYAWILVSPWIYPWYTAIAWVTLTQVPRNRMTRWLTLVTVLLSLWHSSGGQVMPVRL